MTAASRRAAARAIAAEARFAGRAVRLPAPVGDFGPDIRQKQRRVVIGDAADVDDPNRTIRRARIADPIARMVKRGELSARHEAAVAALRALAEEAGHGSKSSIATLGEARGGSRVPAMPPVARGRAAIACERALRLTWPYAHVVAWVALDCRTLEGFARARGIRREDAPRWLRAGLDLLARHFDGGR